MYWDCLKEDFRDFASTYKDSSEPVRNKTRPYHQKPLRFHRRRYCSKRLFQSVVDWLDQIPTRRNLQRIFDGDRFAAVYIEAGLKYYETEESVSRRTQGRPSTSVEPSSTVGSDAGESRPAMRLATSRSTRFTDPLVKQFNYRKRHLGLNRIILCTRDDLILGYVSRVCEIIKETRQSPEPSKDTIDSQLLGFDYLQDVPAYEGEVTEYLRALFFPSQTEYIMVKKKVLQCCHYVSFHRDIVPGAGAHPDQRVSIPKPDSAYGYITNSHGQAFTKYQSIAGKEMSPELGRANHSGLSFPFLVVELKAKEEQRIATNQCLGGSASCVNIIERLNARLREYPDARTVNNTTFSVAANQEGARLYVSWSADESTYHTKEIEFFCFHYPEHLQRFKNVIDNIIDWGKGERLQQIGEALDYILAQATKANSRVAKARSVDTEECSRIKRSRLAHK